MTYFDEIGMITAPDMVFIPKRLVSRTNICDEAKMIFSDVLTENRLHTPDEVKRAMSKICAQFSYLKKIASKRSVDYTRENIEKMFAYLEKQLADCKAQFMERFNEASEKDVFDFDFNS